MWIARSVKLKDLEATLNRLTDDGWQVVSTDVYRHGSMPLACIVAWSRTHKTDASVADLALPVELRVSLDR
jgi:hypothetical protein